MEFKYGLMVQDTKACGQKTMLTDKENSYMQMVTFTRAAGLTIKHMVSELTVTLMEQNTKACGKLTNNMATEKRLGLMVLALRVNTLKG